jgi:hypothetical protein
MMYNYRRGYTKKPSRREKGAEAAAPQAEKTAELPKDERLAGSAFSFERSGSPRQAWKTLSKRRAARFTVVPHERVVKNGG